MGGAFEHSAEHPKEPRRPRNVRYSLGLYGSAYTYHTLLHNATNRWGVDNRKIVDELRERFQDSYAQGMVANMMMMI